MPADALAPKVGRPTRKHWNEHFNKHANGLVMGGELRNGVNGFLTSYTTDSVRFSQQIIDI